MLTILNCEYKITIKRDGFAKIVQGADQSLHKRVVSIQLDEIGSFVEDEIVDDGLVAEEFEESSRAVSSVKVGTKLGRKVGQTPNELGERVQVVMHLEHVLEHVALLAGGQAKPDETVLEQVDENAHELGVAERVEEVDLLLALLDQVLDVGEYLVHVLHGLVAVDDRVGVLDAHVVVAEPLEQVDASSLLANDVAQVVRTSLSRLVVNVRRETRVVAVFAARRRFLIRTF